MSLLGQRRVGGVRNSRPASSPSSAVLPQRPRQCAHAAIGVSVLQRPRLRRRPIPTIVSQASAQQPPPNALSKSVRFQRSVWTFVDAFALLGSVGGALVALLGVVTPSYALTLPLVLPVVSLIAALQREDLGNEDTRQYLSSLTSTLNKDTVQLLAEAKAAISEVRSEVSAGSAAGTKLTILQGKLSTMEGSIISAGRNAREAAQGVGALSERLQREQRAQGEALLANLRQELRRAAAAASADETAALSRLDTRLAAVEGSLAGLEVAQSEGLRRLSMSLNSALVDAEATLQSSVRNEVASSLEAVRRLPQMIAAATAPPQPPQQLQQPQALPPSEAALMQDSSSIEAAIAAAAASAAAAIEPQQAVLLKLVRGLVADEVAAATTRILEQQGEILARLSAPPRSVSLQEEQWEALGRRLSRLERLVEQLPALSEASMSAQLAPIAGVLLPGPEGGGLGAIVDGVGSLGAAQQGVLEEVGAVRGAVETIAGQLLDGLAAVEATVARLSQDVAAVAQMSYTGQPNGTDGSTNVAEGNASSTGWRGGSAVGEDAIAAALAPVSGMLEALTAKLDGVSGELRGLQEQAAATAAAVASTSSAAYEEVRDGMQSDGAAAAAALQAAQSAAAGLSEVRAMLQGLQTATGELSGRLDSFGTALSSSTSDEQLAGIAKRVSGQLAEQLLALRSEVDGQLGGLEQRLAEAAASAAASAAATANVASMAASASDASFGAWLQERSAALGGMLEEAGISGSSNGNGSSREAYAGERDQSSDVGSYGASSSEPSFSTAPLITQGFGPANSSGVSASNSSSSASGQESSSYAMAEQRAVPSTVELPDVDALSEQQLLTEGLRLLRDGREETRVGADFGRADALLRSAVSCFQRASELAPTDARALGNLGNALLAQGELKRALLEELTVSSSPADLSDPALALSISSLRTEASALLTRAGTAFKAVLEAEGWSSRALVNWGRAMTERAQLAELPEAVQKLYTAAIDKFEAVLEEEPGMLAAQYRCGLALEGLASTKPQGSREAAELLTDAANYLSSVVGAAGAEDEALRAAAEVALVRCEAALSAVGAARR